MSTVALLIFATTAVGDPPDPEVVDPPPTLTIPDARIKEGDSGVKHLVFTVRLSAPPGGRSTVNFTTVDGTATVADYDFEPASGVLIFSATDTLGTIDVVVLGDQRLEGNEWFLVRLSSPVGFSFADSEAVGTLTNDERATFVHSWLAATDYRDGTLPSAWGDYNGDGYLDLPLFAGGPRPPFTEMPGFRALLAQGNYHGASSCDYDRDGDPDLVILGYALGERLTPNVLLRNEGDGTFANVAPALGMAIAGNAETAVWGDFDGDGWPDLFAPYYSHVYPWQSFLYHNNGDGTFTDRAAEVGVSLPGLPIQLRPEGAQAADWNDDGYLDLYCASHLFINDGTGRFTDVRAAVGLPVMFDEGSSFVDYDNDGDLDLYLRGYDSPHLYRNDSGHFIEVTAQAGIAGVPYFWGDSWADADNDGDLDLVQHGGRARLMLNQGDGTFERDPDFESVSSGQELSAWADIDRDGDLDVVMGPIGKELLINRLDLKSGFHTSRLRVRVLDADGNETAHGATVRLRQEGGVPGTTQTRVVDGGSGYLSQNEYTVQFGGIGSGRYELEVGYPSPAGRRVVVDGRMDPQLRSIDVSQSYDVEITVFRDGQVEMTTAGVAGVAPLPTRSGFVHSLGPPSPMPARRSVSIPVRMAGSGDVTLAIHDLRGRLVRTLNRGLLPAGPHSVDWDLTDERGVSAATGVYFCRLLVDGTPADTRRLLVVR